MTRKVKVHCINVIKVTPSCSGFSYSEFQPGLLFHLIISYFDLVDRKVHIIIFDKISSFLRKHVSVPLSNNMIFLIFSLYFHKVMANAPVPGTANINYLMCLLILFLCIELKNTIVPENFFKFNEYFFSTDTPTTNKLDNVILVTCF